MQQLPNDQDDISWRTWIEIERDISGRGFEQLPQNVREEIDLWVFTNLDAYAPNGPVEDHKRELRKWYMTWKILFQGVWIPASPCMYALWRYAGLLTSISL